MRKSLSPHYDCPFGLPSMTPGERVIMSGTTIIAQIFTSLTALYMVRTVLHYVYQYYINNNELFLADHLHA